MPRPIGAAHTPLPLFIEVETSHTCNRRCSWCPTGSSVSRHGDQKLMDWAMYLSLVCELETLEYSGWFALHNFNEPLQNPRLNQELQALTDHLPKSTPAVFTNGDLLSYDRLRNLEDAGARHVRVTRYPPSLTAVRDPDEEFNRWVAAKELVAYQWTKTRTRRGYEFHGVVGACQVEVIIPDVRAYTDRGQLVGIGRRPIRTSPCDLTRRSAAVDRLGRLKMCCNVFTDEEKHRTYVVGVLGESTFADLWSSDLMQSLRTCHANADWSATPICRTCTSAPRLGPGA